MWGGWETWVGRVMGTGERTVFGAENVGTAQGGDAEEESPRKGVCRGGDVEGPREPSPGEHSRGRPRGEDAGMVEGPGRGKPGGGRSEWGAHRGEWKGGHGGGGAQMEGDRTGGPTKGSHLAQLLLRANTLQSHPKAHTEPLPLQPCNPKVRHGGCMRWGDMLGCTVCWEPSVPVHTGDIMVPKCSPGSAVCCEQCVLPSPLSCAKSCRKEG